MKPLPRDIVDQVNANLTVRSRRPGQASGNLDPRLQVKIELPGAQVMVLPGRYRTAGQVRSHVDYVLSLDETHGEAHVQKNLDCIRSNLREIGVSDTEIDAEVRLIESAVRREIWRRVILGDHDDGA
jgi:hypothetical protein